MLGYFFITIGNVLDWCAGSVLPWWFGNGALKLGWKCHNCEGNLNFFCRVSGLRLMHVILTSGRIGGSNSNFGLKPKFDVMSFLILLGLGIYLTVITEYLFCRHLVLLMIIDNG